MMVGRKRNNASTREEMHRNDENGCGRRCTSLVFACLDPEGETRRKGSRTYRENARKSETKRNAATLLVDDDVGDAGGAWGFPIRSTPHVL